MELRGSKEAQMMAQSLVRTSAIIGVSAPAKTKKPKLCELSPKPLTQANPPPKKTQTSFLSPFLLQEATGESLGSTTCSTPGVSLTLEKDPGLPSKHWKDKTHTVPNAAWSSK